ncbi:DUF2630 family protein [Streptomyces sp. NBC_01669]|uniref:DUF2630 family protein n=1 Tax=unclassified Streptomyces TaxID=2593676 RepID=UPI002252B59F|nr:DUF2630 family protein [Streptomyces sp. NBC_01669]MCX4534100.1 DUF2630 family protein [Streptomyces sp. NBC_01669]
MDEQEIIDNIGGPISEERTLRDRSTRNMGLRADEKSCLRTVEVQLDQCWDLLRQRRALSEFGDDPNAARVRPADEAEGYQS